MWTAWKQNILFKLKQHELHYVKTTKNFTTKNWKFSDKNSDSFHIAA